jgi:peptide/nickel transport system substrate-binding protein
MFPEGANNYNEMAEEYPYGYNSASIPDAKAVMEENGHSASNKFELTLTTYESASMKQVGQLLRDKLSAAHSELTYEQAPFSTLLTRAEQGSLEMWTSGWIADYPAPDNFLKLLVPSFTQTGEKYFGDSNSSLDWGVDPEEPESEDGSGWTEASRAAEDAWDTIKEYPLPTEDHKAKRNEAYLEIEKANWEDMPMLTIFHSLAEHMDYPWLDKPRVGALGESRQKWNRVKIGNREEYKN